MPTNRKITYFISHPIQYFSPLFRELAKVTDLEVFYFSDAGINQTQDKGFGTPVKWDIPLLDGYKSSFVRNFGKKTSPDNHLMDVFNPGVFRVLRKRGKTTVVVNGWNYSSTLMTIFFARLMGREVWLRAENPLNQELKRSSVWRAIKKLLLRQILFRFFVDKCMYIGKQSYDFFRYYGVDGERLIYTPYAVDNKLFSDYWLRLKDQKEELRRSMGIPAGKKVILFSGKFTAKKRPLDLLTAFSRLGQDDSVLVMVGEGQLRPSIEAFIAEQGLSGRVIMTGFVNQSEIPRYYTVADVFVMCSGIGETWGLAVNEAMNFANPILVSDTCGCSSDLVEHGSNGFIFQEGNVGQLAAYLKQVLDDDAFREKAGRRSLEIVQEYSIDRIVQNISEAK